ncbi:MAG: flagellar export protein FliJ [Pirellula sp.]|jgi:flagellar export protein FliJ|nr:flagellar export protein FliJ [Pirellula sp.]
MAKFRLATLLKIRERERDHAAKNVQDARMAIEKLSTQKQELLAENESMNAIRKSASVGAMNLQSILDTQRFQMVLGAQVQQIENHLGTLNQELQRREAQLLKCQQAVKSLEKLRDQRAEAAETLILQKQQERTDEWASVRFAMDIQSQSDDS